MLTVSIIIVNYNSGGRLANVYKALNAQSFKDFDIIVLDNASEDDSLRQSLPPADLTVTIIENKKNTGFAGGVMDALPHAKGEWLAFLNPDAYPEPEWLEALMRAAQKYGDNSVIGSVQINANAPDILDGLGDVYHASGVAWRGAFGKSVKGTPAQDCEIFAACFAAALVHREAFLALGGLDRDFFCYHEDVDFGFRHRLKGGRAILAHDAIVAHEGSAITGRYSPFTVFHGIRNRQWTFFKNMPLALMPITLPFYLLFSAAFLVRSFMLGIGVPYCKGWLAGVSGIGKMWKKRQPAPYNKWRRVAAMMAWSPLAPLQRAPDLRPIAPNSTQQSPQQSDD